MGASASGWRIVDELANTYRPIAQKVNEVKQSENEIWSVNRT